MTREQLSAIVRVLVGVGMLLLLVVFLRACLSPPPLPATRAVHPDAPSGSGTLPARY